ncbi:hypothetical protein D3C81_1750700 [compost metagenome]
MDPAQSLEEIGARVNEVAAAFEQEHRDWRKGENIEQPHLLTDMNRVLEKKKRDAATSLSLSED